MKKFIKKSTLLQAGVVALTTVAVSAQAAAVDVSEVVGDLTANQASVSAVGSAALLLFGCAVIFRYVKKAF